MDAPTAHPSLERMRFVTDWRALDAKTADAICEFWTREQANVEGEIAQHRVQQVVAHVLDERGDIAAVSTAMPKILPRLGQPMYYYRCFVGKQWRDGHLVRPLLRHTQRVLEDYAREHDFPCIGMLLELENEGFAATLRWAYWPGTGFAYIGRSPRGLDLRVWYFRGARLKTPEELARLVRSTLAAASAAQT